MCDVRGGQEPGNVRYAIGWRHTPYTVHFPSQRTGYQAMGQMPGAGPADLQIMPDHTLNNGIYHLKISSLSFPEGSLHKIVKMARY